MRISPTVLKSQWKILWYISFIFSVGVQSTMAQEEQGVIHLGPITITPEHEFTPNEDLLGWIHRTHRENLLDRIDRTRRNARDHSTKLPRTQTDNRPTSESIKRTNKSQKDPDASLIVQYALQQLGSRSWAYWAPHRLVGGTSAYFGGIASLKCNCFVADAVEQTGLLLEVEREGGQRGTPTVIDYLNRDGIAGLQLVTEDQPILEGDILVAGRHVGIAVRLDKFVRIQNDGPMGSVSASSLAGYVVHNDWPFYKGKTIRVWRLETK